MSHRATYRRRRSAGSLVALIAVAAVLVVAGIAWLLVSRSMKEKREVLQRAQVEPVSDEGDADMKAAAANIEKVASRQEMETAREEAEDADADEAPAAPAQAPEAPGAPRAGEARAAAPQDVAGQAEREAEPQPVDSPAEAAVVHVSMTGDDAGAGTADSPFRTLGKALSVAAESGTIRIAAGTYRERGLKLKRGGRPGRPLVIQGEGRDRTFIKGSVEVKGWKRFRDDIWKVDGWETNSQQVFCDGKHLQQIGERSPWHTKVLWAGKVCLPPVGKGVDDLTPGSFYHDGATNTLYCMLEDRSDPGGHLVEAAVCEPVLSGRGTSHVVLRGVALMHANGKFKGSGKGATLGVGASDWTVEDCLIEYGAFMGVGLSGRNHTLRRCTIRNNGNTGIDMGNTDRAHGWKWYPNATPMNILIEDCLIEGNNYRNFFSAWHAGGMKCIPACRRVTVRGCTVRNNKAPGIWFDHPQGDILIEDNLVVGNRTGIFYEIGAPAEGDEYGALIRNNRVVGSTHQGIYISASEHAIVENNTCYDNWVDIVVHGMPRGEFKLRHNVVRNNIVCGGKLADLMLFVGKDSGENMLDANFYVLGDMRRYGWKPRSKLRIGVVKGKGYDVTHRELKRLSRETGFERQSRSGDPMWANPAALDFRLLRESPAAGKGWQPKVR